MIKKIPVSALRIGMYIDELGCDWLSHPFFRSRFKISDDEQIQKIVEAGIHDVYIDTSRGLDMPDAPTAEEIRQTLHQEMVEIARQPASVIRITAAEEYQRAHAVCDSAQRLVRDVMRDARLGRAVELDQVEPVVEQITNSILRNSSALVGLLTIKNKDEYTFLHSVSVCTLMVAFCRTLGLDAETTRQAGLGGLLHDTGKALIPDEVLNKPGRLTDEEFAIIKQHPQLGYDILKQTAGIQEIPLGITLHHHERMDGQGYPAKLAAADISQLVRMSSIVDVYDAITSDRCYHRGMPATDALRKLHEWSAHHFDPMLVQAFIRCVGIYPVGALVRLESGKLGVVVEQNEDSLLQPKLKIIYSVKSDERVVPYDLDLARPVGHGGGDRIVAHEVPDKWRLDTRPYIQ
ncbi:MAG: HD-GYP domain-containing protein [Rhodocyclaceae bacterium]